MELPLISWSFGAFGFYWEPGSLLELELGLEVEIAVVGHNVPQAAVGDL